MSAAESPARTYVRTIWLRKHPKYEHTFAIFGDPDRSIEAQLETIPYGARVRLVVTPFGADPPSSYTYAWYAARPDIRWEWSGHLNAWGYELAAQHKNQGATQ